MRGHHHTPLQALCPPVTTEHPTHSLCQSEEQSGEATSGGQLGSGRTHLPVLAGWAVLALTAAGPAHHTGQQGEAAADRTTCYCVTSTASTAPSAEGKGKQANCGRLHRWLQLERPPPLQLVRAWTWGVDTSVATINPWKAIHLQSVLTQQRPNWREGTPLGTPPDSQRQAVKEHVSSNTFTGTHNITLRSIVIAESHNVTEQYTPNEIIS